MRRARIRTTHASAEAAAVVAGAVEPDNTDSMATRVDGDRVVTTVERETTGGLHSTVDDYVVNLTVADRLVGGDTDRHDIGNGGRNADETRDGDDFEDDDRDEPDGPADDPTADTDTPERTDPTDNTRDTRDSRQHDTQP